MEKTFYEIWENFKPIYDTAIALLEARDYKELCQLLLGADIEVINTDFDNWHGGTYEYSVYIGINVKQYAVLSSDRITEIEQIVSQSLNEAIKGDNNNSFVVSLSPKIVKNDFDWSLIGGQTEKSIFEQDIETIRNIMISVATNGSRIQDEEDRYRTLNSKVIDNCKKLHITYKNNFQSLWDWYGKWKAEFPSYQERRQFINELFNPTFSAFTDNQVESELDTIVKIDDWDRLKRTLVKIKRGCTIAKHEEDYQAVGHLCRELIITLAQAVFNPDVHGTTDEEGVVIGKTDATRMIDNYISYQLKGSSNEELRAFAKKANKLTSTLTHKRTATKKDMLLTVTSTIALINFIGVFEEKYM